MSTVFSAVRSLQSIDLSPLFSHVSVLAHTIVAWGASAPVVVAASNPPIW